MRNSKCFMFNNILSLLFLLMDIHRMQCQAIEDGPSNVCISSKTCGECIRASPLCAWCGAEKYPRSLSRCDLLVDLVRICDSSDIINPSSSSKITRNEPWSSGGANEPPVQVKPQEVEFVLRPNEQRSFKLMFQQQPDYPVDLYFLLDLSYGMHRQKNARERLVALGIDIPKSMTNITNNFRLGFGTFVDKDVMPYTAWTDRMLQDRCPLKDRQCRSPHDFMNQLNIGANHSYFGQGMKSALETVSQSLDDIEGGLDGLIQALDCDSIGWRSISRRIIVYSSNSLFHLAGDGKLGGATKQNNLKCNLSPDGTYIGDKVYDYPSVSQVAQKLRDKNANVIFAVMSNVAQHYKALAAFLDGATVGELEDDSKNIVSLIQDKYFELRSRIEFQSSRSNDINVEFSSKCKGDILRETSVCDNLEIMDSVEFEVKFTVGDDVCLDKVGSVKKKVILNAVGLNEAVVVNINIHCSCECEISSTRDLKSKECTFGNGTLECGICNCDSGRFGRQCECDEAEITMDMSMEQCKPDVNDTLICSGNGECICGVCECLTISDDSAEKFSGLYCDCNDYNCPLGENQLLCSGSPRGKCKCGACDCLPGWSGDRCECTTDESSCTASNGEVCNGAGECQCGRCVCNETSGMIGPKCEDCVTCLGQCNEYIDCVQCEGFKSGAYQTDEECSSNCSKNPVRLVNDLPKGSGVRFCQGTDIDTCTFYFTYQYDAQNDVIITVQKTKKCPEKTPWEAIIGGTVAGVVLFLLLLVFIFVFIRNLKDRKEYSKFRIEQETALWDTGANPIYKQPTTTFTNIAYRGNRAENTASNEQLMEK